MKETFKIGLFMFAALIAYALSVPAKTHAQNAQTLKVYASKIIANDLNDVCASFGQKRPGLSITVCGGRIANYFKLMCKNSDQCLAVSSRRMTSDEREAVEAQGMALGERLVAKRAIGIVVNSSVPITSLTLKQLRDIFVGTYSNWNQLGGPDLPIIRCARPDPKDGIAVWFRKKVLAGRPVASGSRFLDFDSKLLRAVSSSPGAIGYASMRKRIPEDVNIVALKKTAADASVLPTPRTAADGTYPLVMSLYAYWVESPRNNEVKSLVAFVEKKGI